MKSLLLFILIATQLSAGAQPGNSSPVIDGLKDQLRNSKTDTGRIRLLQALVNAYIGKGNLSPANAVFTELINTCQAAGDKKREAESWFNYAKALISVDQQKNMIDSALQRSMAVYHELHAFSNEIDAGITLAFVHGHHDNLHMAEQQLFSLIKLSEANAAYRLPNLYYYLAGFNRYLGNFNKALGYALQAIKHTKTAADSADIHVYYGEVAEICEALDQPAESASWYQKCVLAREQIAGFSPFLLYRTYGLFVVQLIKAGKQTEALAIINNLRQRRPPKGDTEEAAFALSEAYCYEATGQYVLAEKYYLACINLYDKVIQSGEIKAAATYDIVSFYVKRQQFSKTTPFLQRLASTGMETMQARKQADLLLMQFKVDSAAGNYVAAIEHFQQHKSLQDSMFNAVKSKQIEELQIQYQTEVKDQNIQLLTKKDQVQQLGLRQAAATRNTILIVTVLLVLLLALGYNRYRLKQKSNQLLEQQQQEINQQNTSLQHLVEEKEWLVKEIHHRVKNNFHIVMSLLGTQANYLKHEEAKLAMSEAQQRIHTMALIHQKLYQSENLSSVNMADYIHELVDYLRDSMDAGTHIRFDLQIEPVFLPITHSLPIGLILNEAITNAIKHAFPHDSEKRIRIGLQHAGEHDLVLTIADNGVGIAAHVEADHHDSMGMGLMQGLSDDIRGVFSITQQEGTLITVRFNYLG